MCLFPEGGIDAVDVVEAADNQEVWSRFFLPILAVVLEIRVLLQKRVVFCLPHCPREKFLGSSRFFFSGLHGMTCSSSLLQLL